MTTNNRAFHLVFTLVSTVLALVVLSAPSAYADSTTVNISNFNGFYGYQVGNNTPGRNVNISGAIPLELLTASSSTEKDLYGVAQIYTFSFSEAATYKVTTRFVLRQRVDTYYLDTPQSNKTSTWTFADNSTTTTNCTVRYDYETSYYLVVFDCSYSGSKRPVSSIATLGSTSGFTVGTTSPIMVSNGNNTSIDVYLSQYSYELFDDSGAAIADGIENLGNTIEDIHQDEKDTINDAVDDAHNAANGLSINFSVINPIINWLALFRDDACVSIPTISSWLNTNETLVCSPWRNTPVRGGLTPIFTLLGTMLVTAFVFRWLSSNNSEGTVEGV